MQNWLIYRHGSNAANQSMTPVMPVCIVNGASDGLKAIARVVDEIVVYNNQFLSAVAEEECDADEWDSIVTDSAMMTAVGENGLIFDCN